MGSGAAPADPGARPSWAAPAVLRGLDRWLRLLYQPCGLAACAAGGHRARRLRHRRLPGDAGERGRVHALPGRAAAGTRQRAAIDAGPGEQTAALLAHRNSVAGAAAAGRGLCAGRARARGRSHRPLLRYRPRCRPGAVRWTRLVDVGGAGSAPPRCAGAHVARGFERLADRAPWTGPGRAYLHGSRVRDVPEHRAALGNGQRPQAARRRAGRPAPSRSAGLESVRGNGQRAAGHAGAGRRARGDGWAARRLGLVLRASGVCA